MASPGAKAAPWNTGVGVLGDSSAGTQPSAAPASGLPGILGPPPLMLVSLSGVGWGRPWNTLCVHPIPPMRPSLVLEPQTSSLFLFLSHLEIPLCLSQDKT